MSSRADPTVEAAKSIYAKFIKENDPDVIDRRWSRLKPATKSAFIDEADAAIKTYQKLTR